ncbi:hypothetical protein [Usitatibacter palustris]|uniref:Uncharacterized protein n=1 Tax=Usitatibacter palustris TaxID=2732487 RepID=A0A6M4H4T6_9PROT|nr:hypothetical protein [Usitatibacter palustris]QJR13534.1 hypothetical protein DSM104440_00318 [Usitatibacter palustris]
MKPFTAMSIALLSLVSVVQLIRLVLGWDVSINGIAIPLWASGIAFIVSGGLAVMLWRESRTSQP